MSAIQQLISYLKEEVVKQQTPMDRYEDWLKTAGLDKKKHQIQGMDFCIQREATKKPYGVKGGIICDEMGLGKTILMLGSIAVNPTGSKGLSQNLIVVPPALLSQWVKIVKKFMGFSPLVYHGYGTKHVSDDKLAAAPIVLTTYGMISERKLGTGRRLWKTKWLRLIMDEAHHIRNMKTGAFKGAMKIKAEIKWLVSGTPVQNAYSDFCALCSVLGLKSAFYANPDKVKTIVNHHVLRRTKKQVGINLPPLNDSYVEVEWASRAEKKLAQQIHSMAKFSNVTLENVDQVIRDLTHHPLPMLIRARQVCTFPHLVGKAINQLKKAGLVDQQTKIGEVKTASKAKAVVEHVLKRINNNRRKIIFCHYRGEIDLIAAMLRKKGVNIGTLDGRTNKQDRAKILEFRDDGTVPEVIAVQIQTACEGLNLQHFQEVYFTSPHWNPAVEDQAIARAHRIGQNDHVDVFRFVMKDFSVCTCGNVNCKTEAGITLDTYCRMVQEKKRKLASFIEKDYKNASPVIIKKISDLEDRSRDMQTRTQKLMALLEQNAKKLKKIKKAFKKLLKKPIKTKKIPIFYFFLQPLNP